MVKNCCLKAPGSGEVVTVVLKDSRRGSIRSCCGTWCSSMARGFNHIPQIWTTRRHSRDREHFNQNTTLNTNARTQVQDAFNTRKTSQNQETHSARTWCSRPTRHSNTNTTPTPTDTYRTCSKKRLSLHGKRSETRISKSHFAMGCANVSWIWFSLRERQNLSGRLVSHIHVLCFWVCSTLWEKSWVLHCIVLHWLW